MTMMRYHVNELRAILDDQITIDRIANFSNTMRPFQSEKNTKKNIFLFERISSFVIRNQTKNEKKSSVFNDSLYRQVLVEHDANTLDLDNHI